ncbi:hypothetical protein HG536_0H03550 [Torulaspora globosa]|uniref:GATA-type domain-containing protein n=1 Tax=Torulaspora globosa TaxID=48254 RepID=A0A7G3ZN93_9SACH|nr:uncharacterized protein HG536_0H03550 [Torulaspora globosa]QLL34979.1 hypothetical protein HG536_0H03550 [Torulaspora globosa]
MKNDTTSRSSTVGICSEDGARVSYDYYFSLDSRNKLTKTASQQRRGRLVQSFPPPPPPPPPTRESSVPPAERLTTSSATSSVICKTPYLRLDGVPRNLPDLRSYSVLAGSTTFIRSSGIRGTLPRIRKLEVRKQCHMPLADVLVSSGGPTSGSQHGSTSVKRASEVDSHEQDAATALLVLKQCSLKVADMTRSWSHLNTVPLCDFIVAQKNCQRMLDNIETLKDVRIQVREATAVEDVNQNDELTRHAIEKRKRKNLYKSRSRAFPSRSSSVISVVNVIKKERENETRSQSTSSECTTTKSPTEMACDISRQEPHSSYNEPSRQSSSSSSSDYAKRVLGKIGKTSKSGKNRNTHMKCLQCSATDTPEWRKGPVGPTTLCNACGLFYKKLLKRFGGDTADVIMKMRQIKNPQDRKVPRSASS